MIGNLTKNLGTFSGDLTKSAEAVQARASEISGIVPAANEENSWWIPPKTTTSLTFVATALQNLAGAVDGADAAPTQDARDSYGKLRATADGAVAAWSEFKAKDLAAFNDKLKAAGLAPIAMQ